MIMANSILDQSSQEVLRTLDEQLKECTPLESRPWRAGTWARLCCALGRNKKGQQIWHQQLPPSPRPQQSHLHNIIKLDL